MGKNRSVQIKGGSPIYGKAALSGDTNSAASLISRIISSGRDSEISNVPRTIYILELIETLKEINVDIDWVGIDTVLIKNSVISDDISFLKSNKIDLINILIPIILSCKNTCIISSEIRAVARFYRKVGFTVEVSGKKLTISVPLKGLKGKAIPYVKKEVSTEIYHLLLQNNFPEIKFWAAADQGAYDPQVNFEVELQKEMCCRYNQYEFNLISTLAAFTQDEIIIEGFSLPESLPYLLELNKLGVMYEVTDDKLRMWQYEADPIDYLDLTKFPVDIIGYVLLVLIFNYSSSTQIVTHLSEQIEKLITNLNIIGAKISYAKGDNTLALTVKPSNLSSLKLDDLDYRDGGVYLLAASVVNGSSKFADISQLENYTPGIINTLRGLNINITSK